MILIDDQSYLVVVVVARSEFARIGPGLRTSLLVYWVVVVHQEVIAEVRAEEECTKYPLTSLAIRSVLP